MRPDLIPTIEKWSKEYHMCPELIEAVIETESMGQMLWNGSHTCYGLMQCNVEYHADRCGRHGLSIYSEEGNIVAGIDYLKELCEKYGDLYLVLGHYNGQSKPVIGPGNKYAQKILDRAYDLEELHSKHLVRYIYNRKKLDLMERRM